MQVPSRFGRWRRALRWLGPPAGVLVGSLLGRPGPASAAAADGMRVQVLWNGSRCGDVSAFTSRVARRTDRVRFVTGGAELRISVGIEAGAQGLNARVAFSSGTGAASVRQITSPDCDDALDALALVVAIGIDERWREARTRAPAPRRRRAAAGGRPSRAARTAEAPVAPAPEAAPPAPAFEAPVPAAAPPSEPAASPTPAPPPGPVAPAPAPRAEPVAARVSLPPPPAAPAASPPRAASPETARTGAERELPHWSWDTGVSARLLQGLAPELLLGGEVWLRIAWEQDSAWSPEFGLSLSHQVREGFAAPGGDADFALSAGSLEYCPLRLGRAELQARPCVHASLGRSSVSGHRTFEARSESRPWAALGAGVEGVARLGVLALRVSADAGRPLLRDSYGFGSAPCGVADCEAFHRVAPVVWSLAAGAGVSFR